MNITVRSDSFLRFKHLEPHTYFIMADEHNFIFIKIDNRTALKLTDRAYEEVNLTGDETVTSIVINNITVTMISKCY